MSELDQVLRDMVAREVARQLAELRAAPAAPPELVTIAAYARARSISVSTVRAAIAAGRLEARRIGRAVRVPATAEIARPLERPTTRAQRTADVAARLGIRVLR